MSLIPRIRTPDELRADEQFRAELRDALTSPVIQGAIASLRQHRGLFRTTMGAAPANAIHHAAVWTGGFNAALDSLESLTTPPSKKTETPEPYSHILADDI